MDRVHAWNIGLLVGGGLLLGIPQLYQYFTFGGAPWLAVLVGWASVIVAVVITTRSVKQKKRKKK